MSKSNVIIEKFPIRMCEVEGCDKKGHNTGLKRKDGSRIRRDKCSEHHNEKIANNNGFDRINSFRNTKHPSKKYRKTYCENIDGRLGFKCTSTILDPERQLDADHINGNPSDNRAENIQTLCKCCHPIKSMQEKDHLTPGRKTLGIKR